MRQVASVWIDEKDRQSHGLVLDDGDQRTASRSEDWSKNDVDHLAWSYVGGPTSKARWRGGKHKEFWEGELSLLI